MKTNQEIFTEVATHLLTQMKQSVIINDVGSTSCLYRGPDGTKCAVGCLIPDELYTHKIEGRGILSVRAFLEDRPRNSVSAGTEILIGILKRAGIDLSGPSLLLLTQLQDIHDAGRPEQWAERLQDLAEAWRLTMPKVPSAD